MITWCTAQSEEFTILGPSTHVQATEGELVHLQCSSSATNDLPLWLINGTSYTATTLPYWALANASGLVFPAYSFVNNTSFQCFFTRYHPETGKLFRHTSNVTRVTVRQLQPGEDFACTHLGFSRDPRQRLWNCQYACAVKASIDRLLNYIT